MICLNILMVYNQNATNPRIGKTVDNYISKLHIFTFSWIVFNRFFIPPLSSCLPSFIFYTIPFTQSPYTHVYTRYIHAFPPHPHRRGGRLHPDPPGPRGA